MRPEQSGFGRAGPAFRMTIAPVSAGLLDHDILTAPPASGDAIGLLGSGAAIYLTNIIAFGVWYWEIDRGGPFARMAATELYPDFLFPQMATPNLAPPNWRPNFLDYLYVGSSKLAGQGPVPRSVSAPELRCP